MRLAYRAVHPSAKRKSAARAPVLVEVCRLAAGKRFGDGVTRLPIASEPFVFGRKTPP